MNVEAIDPFEKQNIFKNKMIEDYKAGIIPNSSAFDAYFKWKIGEKSHTSISKDMAYCMINEASKMLEYFNKKYPDAYKHLDTYINDDPWQEYKGFEKDKYIVSYLERIEGELTNLIFLLN